MGPDNPSLAVASALHAAQLRDLPDIVYDVPDTLPRIEWLWSMTREKRNRIYQEERAAGEYQGPVVARRRRPTWGECNVTVFSQEWGSALLGYGGIDGSAITKACTVVVSSRIVGMRAVYFGASGRLAYVMPIGGAHEEAFQKAVAECALPCVCQAQALGWLPAQPRDRAGAAEPSGAAITQLARRAGKPLSEPPEHDGVPHRGDGLDGPDVYSCGGHYAGQGANRSR